MVWLDPSLLDFYYADKSSPFLCVLTVEVFHTWTVVGI